MNLASFSGALCASPSVTVPDEGDVGVLGIGRRRTAAGTNMETTYVADQLQDGTRFPSLTVVDVYTREVLAIEPGQSLKGR